MQITLIKTRPHFSNKFHAGVGLVFNGQTGIGLTPRQFVQSSMRSNPHVTLQPQSEMEINIVRLRSQEKVLRQAILL